MKQIELISALPDWQWKEHSQKEIQITGKELVGMSDFVWRVGHVAVAGFIHNSYTSPPWMWFVLAEGVKIADLIDFRKLSEKIPKGTLTAVNANFAVGLKFAKVYDFVETGTEEIYLDCLYKIMRKI